MSFQTLPPELFLQILYLLLYNEDRDSLRLTCRKFYNCLPKPYTTSFSPGVNESLHNFRRGYYGKVSSRLTHLTRLFLPGNIYHNDPTIAICGRCLLIRPLHKFPIDVIQDGHPRCEECIITIMGENMGPGSWLEHNDSKYKKCSSCSKLLDAEELHCHDGQRAQDGVIQDHSVCRHMCKDCHTAICRDPSCAGYTMDYIMGERGQFCTSIRYHICGYCENCKMIEAMERRHRRKGSELL